MARLRAGHPEAASAVLVALDGPVKPGHDMMG
jgi:hypothetical protein